MIAQVEAITLGRLAIALLPALIVAALMWRWSERPWLALYALARMLLQLLLIGYVLTFVFETSNPLVVGLVLAVMLISASWIALRTLEHRTWRHLFRALTAITLGGGATLLLMTQAVLSLEPWFEPMKVIPLAGMALANAMNTVSLASERFASECAAGQSYAEARAAALRASMIPPTNALLAVGLVSIPGMMTGQVLAGVDPLIAARYQIMVMAMIYSSAGLSAGWYLASMKPQATDAPT